ncbi:MAG: cation:proton antiporter [Verrucomicrobia bacterium]|nr:cation:proton antiporter [Verrucomicrobiota bacterium]
MNHATFLQDIAVVMIVAAIVTVVFRQLKQPVVLGYILAGLIIGPHTPPFPLIVDENAIKTLSELGVIFLMFSLGLEFSLRKLRAVGATAIIAATMEILLMVWAGFELGQIFGWNQMDSIFLGAILSISSTTIIIKAIEELGRTKERFAEIVFGILIVEDILAIVMIALLSGFATTGALAAADVGMMVVKLVAFLGVLLVAGLIVVPRLLNYVARFGSNEVLLITVIGLCFGISLLAVKLGYSVALGAFLIGAIIAEARQIAKIEVLTHPVRDLFSAVFFVSIGLLIDPALLVKYAGPIVIITVVVVVGKVLACSFGTFIAGHDERSSLRVGMGLAQIGEFSFIIASLGLTLNVTSEFLYPIAVAVSALTTLLTPYLIRHSDTVVGWFVRAAPAPLVRTLAAYTRWVGQLGVRNGRNMGAVFLRRVGWQIALNLLLVTAVFIGAAALREPAFANWPTAPGGNDGVKAMLWLGAMMVSLPMLITSFRKLQAFAMLVAEMSVSHGAAGKNTLALRAVVSGIIVTAASAGLVLFILLLSTAILPSPNTLLIAALVFVVAAVLLWRAFSRLYARAQLALRETLAQPPPPRHDELRAALPPLLRDAQLEMVKISENSPTAGKTIGELRLRSGTGASIVGIDHGDRQLANPSPEEEIRAGDQVLLLGNRSQLDAAKALIQRK